MKIQGALRASTSGPQRPLSNPPRVFRGCAPRRRRSARGTAAPGAARTAAVPLPGRAVRAAHPDPSAPRPGPSVPLAAPPSVLRPITGSPVSRPVPVPDPPAPAGVRPSGPAARSGPLPPPPPLSSSLVLVPPCLRVPHSAAAGRALAPRHSLAAGRALVVPGGPSARARWARSPARARHPADRVVARPVSPGPTPPGDGARAGRRGPSIPSDLGEVGDVTSPVRERSQPVPCCRRTPLA